MMERDTRRRWTAAGIAVALTATVAACGGDGGGSAGEDVLRVGVPTDLISVDPHGSAAADRGTLTVSQHLFDPLVRSEGGEITGALAESWENVDDTTVRFTLREDVRFHDDTELTSADVKASLDRLREASTALSPLWANLTSVEAPDPQTVEIQLSEPTGALLTNLSLAYIGSEEQITSGEIETAPVGTGPFALESFDSGEGVTLTANPDYWDGEPSVGRLELTDIPEASSRLTSLETGEIDLTYALPPDQLEQVRGFDSVTVETVPSVVFYVLWFNNANEPFDDPDVRKALWHAVDFDTIRADLFGESAVMAQAPIPQEVYGAAQLSPYEYDPALAQQMLADAGYPDGFETSIQWNSECCPNIRPLVQTILSAWEEIGVTVEMQEKEAGQWLDDLLALNWDINIQDGTVVTSDGEFVLGRLYTCAAERLGYCNEEYDSAMAQAARELDATAREQLMQEAQQILWDDAPGIWPYELTATAAWRDEVSGFQATPNNVPDFRGVSVG